LQRMKMSERHEQKKRQLFLVIGILIGVLVVLALLSVLVAILQRRIRSHSPGRDLTGLGKAMQIYGSDSDGKPAVTSVTCLALPCSSILLLD